MGLRRIGRALCAGLLVFLATVFVVVGVQILWPSDTVPDEADAIVCLGGWAEDGQLGQSSRLRATRCIDLYETGLAPQIIFTGTVAAPLMADLAEERGVPRTAVTVENESRSTLQNALFTARLLQGDARVILVTDAYHLPRSWVTFRVMGFADQALVRSHRDAVPLRHLGREAMAIWFNAGRVMLWWATPWLAQDTRDALLI